MPIIMQHTLFGGPVVTGTIVDRMTFILEEHPEAREDYKTAMFLYWLEFEGLNELLGDRADEFRRWWTRSATSPKTLQNRTMEIQNSRPDLEASPETEEQRQRQATAGPVQ